MRTKVLVNGAFGRMGQTTVKVINDHANFELVGQTGKDYDLKKAIIDSKAQIVIDFTQPSAVYQNTLAILETDARPIIGTTGLKRDQILSLQKTCREMKRGGLIAPNFSLGAILLMKYAKEIIKYMPHAEIIEMHHDDKIDSPSGTAIRTAELMSETTNNINQPEKDYRETLPGARGAHCGHIPIHAIRLPGILAKQEVIFGEPGETLTLSHHTIDRQCFMPGIVLACEKVMQLDQLIYGLEEIL